MVCLRDDQVFGPAVRGCRDDFDFTQSFEDVFFSIIPASVFIFLGVARIVFLVRRPQSIAGGRWLQWAKLIFALALVATEVSQLILSTQDATVWTSGLRLPANVLRLTAIGVVLPVSILEHSRCRKPSALLEVFLSVTVLLDAGRARTLWLSSLELDGSLHWARLAIVSVLLKAGLLLLESLSKSQRQHHDKTNSLEEGSGLFALASYAWLNRLFYMGYTNVLSIDDLFLLDKAMTIETLRASDKAKFENHAARTNVFEAWLVRRLFKVLAVPLFLPVVPRLAVIGFTFCQPFLIEAVLSHLESPDKKAIGYGLIGATALIYLGMALSYALYFYWAERFVYMSRGLLVTAIYRKTAALSTTIVADSSALTLMNTDIQRVRMGLLPLHEYWANTVEVALACWLLQRKIGAAFAAPIVVVVVCVAASFGVASLTGKRQRAWMQSIEERVAATSTMISTIKSLRITGLLQATENLIHGLRLGELAIGGKWRLMLVVAVALSYTPTTIGPLMAFATTSSTLSVTRIFPAMAFIMLMAMPLVSLFQNIPNLISALACLARIQAFLDQPDRTDRREGSRHPDHDEEMKRSSLEQQKLEKSDALAIDISGAAFGWSSEKMILNDINLKCPPGSLTIVRGSVAEGKSSLLKGILGEVPISTGTIRLDSAHKAIAYCDQKPYLSDGTIRYNVVGNAEFDASRYQDVVDAASLSPDFMDLTHEDSTKIGSSGMSLSGGQQARVALARALYLPADLYILDDLMSGLDASTAARVFHRTFAPGGLLRRRGATILLCSHDERYAAFADQIVVLENGQAFSGSLQEMQRKGHLQEVKRVVESPTTKIPDATTDNVSPENAIESPEITQHCIEDPNPDKSRQTGDFEVYGHYFSSMSIWAIAAFLFACLSFGFTINFPNVWLRFWSSDVVRPSPNQTSSFYIGIFGLLQVTCLLSLSGVVLLCTQTMISQSGRTLHKETLRAVVQAPLWFFSKTDAGTIVNLFAQDMTLIDSELPLALLNFSASVFSVLGAAAVIATSSPWLAISYPLLVGVLWALQLFYLRTSRQLRLLDLEAQAPLFSHFINTLSGLATIRAHRQVGHFITTNDHLLDRSQRPAYLLAMIQRWLQFVLRVVVAILATVVVAVATQIQSDSGLTGASLITLMSFGDQLSLIVQSYTQLETSIGAVARLKDFASSTPEEESDGALVPDEGWPSRGSIVIRGVSASYNSHSVQDKEDGDLALRNIDLDINPGERVAICGRTGSGKSSLVLLLLRLLDPIFRGGSGHISIDDVPLATIHRDITRRQIIAISQDPIFLPGSSQSTIRANLDPYSEATANEMHQILKLLNLNFLVDDNGSSNDNCEGLDKVFAPDMLSQGQKQLMSLARALVKQRVKARSGVRGGILLLDEATSSVDSKTDEIMVNTIEREFRGYTTVAVAHRLDWAMRSDRVVMMDAGEVVETGSPQDLMATEASAFKRLCDSRDT